MKYFIYLFGAAVAQLAYNSTEGLIRALRQTGTRNAFASDFQDIINVARDVPARRLATARGIPSVSSTSVMQHLRRAYISTCPSEKVLGFSCVCNTKYKDMVIIKDAKVESLALMAADITTKHIVVTYRPTITLKNWITNADYEFVAMDQAPHGVKVHRGFHRFHSSIKKRCLRQPISS
ncbi:hypothetical protein DSO57_1004553 [Entomophthora muscae]|uniref:Uncharacterized protein n=1 Tax=Entomophthora muscae TaxID=34485 RepID=A0ACC2SAU7_9FUNG|nr:hypothetical protein DSO57_1004553 [Entomophthora muscae]